MLTVQETRRYFRKGRLQNARFFFMKDPLGLLTEAAALHIQPEDALHIAGPSLRRTRQLRPMTDEERQILEEVRASMLDAYADDYAAAVARNLREYGIAYAGD